MAITLGVLCFAFGLGFTIDEGLSDWRGKAALMIFGIVSVAAGRLLSERLLQKVGTIAIMINILAAVYNLIFRT